MTSGPTPNRASRTTCILKNWVFTSDSLTPGESGQSDVTFEDAVQRLHEVALSR